MIFVNTLWTSIQLIVTMWTSILKYLTIVTNCSHENNTWCATLSEALLHVDNNMATQENWFECQFSSSWPGHDHQWTSIINYLWPLWPQPWEFCCMYTVHYCNLRDRRDQATITEWYKSFLWTRLSSKAILELWNWIVVSSVLGLFHAMN